MPVKCLRYLRPIDRFSRFVENKNFLWLNQQCNILSSVLSSVKTNVVFSFKWPCRCSHFMLTKHLRENETKMKWIWLCVTPKSSLKAIVCTYIPYLNERNVGNGNSNLTQTQLNSNPTQARNSIYDNLKFKEKARF